MRHFFPLPLAVGLLAPGMAKGAEPRPLVASAGAPEPVLPGQRRASRAVKVAAVAAAAQADLTTAALAIE